MAWSKEDIKSRFKQYSDSTKAKDWFEKNYEKITQLFENSRVNNFVFESFQGVFKTPPKTIDRDIYFVITQVAIINMVLAGLPGQMGVGVFVSMALEAWMAYKIAQHVGIEFKKPSDVFQYFGAVAATLLTIVFVFKHLLSFAYSLVSVVIPVVNPLIIAELLVTNFIGIVFWIGFSVLKKKGKFLIPKIMIIKLFSHTKNLFTHQYSLLKAVLTPSNIKNTGNRIKDWLTGNVATNQKVLNGELFANTAMIYMVAGEYEKLNGPLGDVFIQAIKLRWSNQFSENSTIEEIAERFREYSPEALSGAINTIKGKMFEIMVTNAENANDDSWIAKMHDDESFPGSDIVFTNLETGEMVEVSLKATSAENTHIIEHALMRFPDLPIMTTEEAAELYENNEKVFSSGVEEKYLQEITQENANELIEKIESFSSTHVIFNGVIIGQSAALWPFLIAYMRKKIDYETFEMASKKIFGELGIQLASRLSWAIVLGPVYAWYLLARGVDMLVKAADDIEKNSANKRNLVSKIVVNV